MSLFSQKYQHRLSSFVQTHWVTLAIAVAVGGLYIAPHLFFIVSLGESYKGIPSMHTANEDFYLARIQEIRDGHPSLGSQAFWEYKDVAPLSPPLGEFLYALPTLIFGISPSSTLVGSRFLLPAILFLLVFFLIRRLIKNDDTFAGKCTAFAGALFVTLGYDLIDYGSILNFLSGKAPLSSGFLIWARPVNPILGAIFLFSFLLCVWPIFSKKGNLVRYIFGASLFLALMMGSYFFSWGAALSVLAVLVIFLLVKKEWKTAGATLLIIPLGVAFSFPYWFSVWGATASPWYTSSVLRSGLFLTHYPLLNKLLLVALFLFLLLTVVDFLQKRRKLIAYQVEYWHLFCLSLLLGGLVMYSQQIITGRTVWPYHFVQYTIPLAGVALITTLFQFRKSLWYLWHASITLCILLSMSYGVYVQASSFSRFYAYDKELQNLSSIFEWLNKREPDCVVLVVEEPYRYGIEGLIPAFTHCNVYYSTWVYSLMPDDRIMHNYLTRLFFKGLSSEQTEAYLEKEDEEHVFLFSNWKGLYRVPQFPDFSDSLVHDRIQNLPAAYREFVDGDIEKELKKYRLDYILSVGPLSQNVLKKIPQAKFLEAINDMYLYTFN